MLRHCCLGDLGRLTVPVVRGCCCGRDHEYLVRIRDQHIAFLEHQQEMQDLPQQPAAGVGARGAAAETDGAASDGARLSAKGLRTTLLEAVSRRYEVLHKMADVERRIHSYVVSLDAIAVA